jgi:hypothetical protein
MAPTLLLTPKVSANRASADAWRTLDKVTLEPVWDGDLLLLSG